MSEPKKKFLNRIDEDTLLPVGIVITIMSAVFWFASFYSSTQASAQMTRQNSMDITEMDKDRIRSRQSLYDTLNKIDRRLSYIEGAMKIQVRSEAYGN